jgi:hypothetical protein
MSTGESNEFAKREDRGMRRSEESNTHRSCLSFSHSYSCSTFQSDPTGTSIVSPPQTGQSGRFSGLNV